jgi:hypothetical protein
MKLKDKLVGLICIDSKYYYISDIIPNEDGDPFVKYTMNNFSNDSLSMYHFMIDEIITDIFCEV